MEVSKIIQDGLNWINYNLICPLINSVTNLVARIFSGLKKRDQEHQLSPSLQGRATEASSIISTLEIGRAINPADVNQHVMTFQIANEEFRQDLRTVLNILYKHGIIKVNQDRLRPSLQGRDIEPLSIISTLEIGRAINSADVNQYVMTFQFANEEFRQDLRTVLNILYKHGIIKVNQDRLRPSLQGRDTEPLSILSNCEEIKPDALGEERTELTVNELKNVLIEFYKNEKRELEEKIQNKDSSIEERFKLVEKLKKVNDFLDFHN